MTIKLPSRQRRLLREHGLWSSDEVVRFAQEHDAATS